MVRSEKDVEESRHKGRGGDSQRKCLENFSEVINGSCGRFVSLTPAICTATETL